MPTRAKANEGSFSKTLYGNNSKELSILMLDDPEHASVSAPWCFRRSTSDRSMRCCHGLRKSRRELADDIEAAGRRIRFCPGCSARRLPTTVMAELLGINAADRKDFRRWSLGCMQALNPFRTPEQTALV